MYDDHQRLLRAEQADYEYGTSTFSVELSKQQADQQVEDRFQAALEAARANGAGA